MPPQVVVRARVDALDLLPAHRKQVLNIDGRIGVVRQLLVHVEAQVIRPDAVFDVPLQPLLLPGLERSICVPGFTKYCISICSNSRIRKMNCRATISLRNALPICAMPKGIWSRDESFTL